MRLASLLPALNEARASDDVLYHYTNIVATSKILKTNTFHLTPDGGTGADQALRGSNGSFYLSTTRHKLGGYSLYPHRGVMLNLNGDKFTHNYKVKSVDYWGAEHGEINPAKKEAEDRIYAHTMTIPNATDYIRSIHFLEQDAIEDSRDFTKNIIRAVMIDAKKMGIPFFYYDNEKNFMLQKNPVDFPIDQLKRSEPYQKPYSPRERNYLLPLIELIKRPANQAAHLSPKSKKMLYNMSVYSDTHLSIAADLHNDKLTKHAAFVTAFMRQQNINSPQELVQYLNEKWKDS